MQNQEQQMNPFKKAIQDFLRKTAMNDSTFKQHLFNKDKNIDDCLTYIMNTVKATKRQGFENDEIFGMAMHYYEEKDVKVGGKVQAQVIVNTAIQLTAEQIEEERQKAKDKIYQEESAKLRVVKTPRKTTETKKVVEPQGTLF